MITTNKTLWWEAVFEAAEYRVRIVPTGEPATVQTVFQTVPKTAETMDKTEAEIKLFDLVQLQGKEGTFDFAITAVDANGLESDSFVIEGIEIDFLPPIAPTRGGVR